MAPHGLHHGVAVHTGGKPRPYADDHRRVGDGRTQVPLGQDGVYLRIRPQRLTAPALRVGQNRDDLLCQKALRLRRIGGQHGGNALYLRPAQHDSLGKAHRPPDGGGRGQVRHHHLHMAAVQPQGDAGGNIPRAADQNSHATAPYLFDTNV